MITLGGITLLSTSLHQMPEEDDFADDPIVISTYGVRGSLEFQDEQHGRLIRIECTFSGYSTAALLKAARDTVDNYTRTLRDKTLVFTGAGSTLTYYHCSLLKVERLPNDTGRRGPYYDGSGVNGWREELAFHFWQLDNKQ